jgi:hypothetical protein
VTDAATRDQIVERVVDDANPQAVTSLIGPGKPLPQNVATDDAILHATDDAFIEGIRIAMLVGFGVVLSALVLGWFVFPRRRSPSGGDPPARAVATGSPARRP